MQVGDGISDEARRAIYPELLKRLDDSSNKVCMQLERRLRCVQCWECVPDITVYVRVLNT